MKRSGQSILEVILAASIFMIIATGMVGLVVQSVRANRLGLETSQATYYNTEGLEAVRSIKNQAFSNLNSSPSLGLTQVSNLWTFSGTTNVFDGKFIRSIGITEVFRDGNGHVVASGGTLDPLSKKITVNTTWQFSSARTNSVNLTSYLTDWRKPIRGRTGMVVFGNGLSSNDTISYRVLDIGGSWSATANSADIDTSSANRYLRSVQLYSSPTRDEKVMISRHYRATGTIQSIYMQVFNGISWGNVNVGSSWVASTYLDAINFSGTYLDNGDFVAVYSDNTSTPKYSVWNGSSWSPQYSMVNLANNGSAIPVWIVARSRAGTNEVMVASYDSAKDTNTQYYNGQGYSIGNWTLHSRHASTAQNIAVKTLDLDWSSNNPLVAGLIFSKKTNDKSITSKIWTANGSGGGAWSNASSSPLVASNIAALDLVSLTINSSFLACTKDANTTPRIICFILSNSNAWSTPTNNTIVTGTDAGTQRSYHMESSQTSGLNKILVYSDTTAIPKIKKYNPNTNSWDISAVSLPTISSATETVRIIPSTVSDDLIILMGNTSQALYSLVWNATTDSYYTISPIGFGLTQHGTQGSNDLDYWFDFSWD